MLLELLDRAKLQSIPLFLPLKSSGLLFYGLSDPLRKPSRPKTQSKAPSQFERAYRHSQIGAFLAQYPLICRHLEPKVQKGRILLSIKELQSQGEMVKIGKL